jgi:hypothetical protein
MVRWRKQALYKNIQTMAIVNLRIIRKTVEAIDSERIFEETVWKQRKLFGIPIMFKKVSYHCTANQKTSKGIGFKAEKK